MADLEVWPAPGPPTHGTPPHDLPVGAVRHFKLYEVVIDINGVIWRCTDPEPPGGVWQQLTGPEGVQSIEPGDNVTVDSSDAAHPVVSATSGGSGLPPPDFVNGYQPGFGVQFNSVVVPHSQNAVLIPSDTGIANVPGGGAGPIDDAWMTWTGAGATQFTPKRAGWYMLTIELSLAAPAVDCIGYDIKQPGSTQPTLWGGDISKGDLAGAHLDGIGIYGLAAIAANLPVQFRFDTSLLAADPTIAYAVVLLSPLFTP